MCLLKEEMLEFNACMENLRAMEFKGRPRMLYKVYRQTLAEHNLNIYKEMENASLEDSDDKARKYLTEFNLKLRKHFNSFPTNYDHPKRLYGQRGALRKPKNMSPIVVGWPDE